MRLGAVLQGKPISTYLYSQIVEEIYQVLRFVFIWACICGLEFGGGVHNVAWGISLQNTDTPGTSICGPLEPLL